MSQFANFKCSWQRVNIPHVEVWILKMCFTLRRIQGILNFLYYHPLPPPMGATRTATSLSIIYRPERITYFSGRARSIEKMILTMLGIVYGVRPFSTQLLPAKFVFIFFPCSSIPRALGLETQEPSNTQYYVNFKGNYSQFLLSYRYRSTIHYDKGGQEKGAL